LDFIFRNPEPKGRLARWAVILSKFEFKVVHKAGCSNQVADALSRQRNAERPDSGSDDAEIVVHAPILQVEVDVEQETSSQGINDAIRSLLQGGQPISLTT
jgi:hypothetical protein